MKPLKHLQLFEDRLESLRALVQLGLADDASKALVKALDYMIAGSEGSLNLEGSDIVSLPDGLKVGATLVLRGCTELKSLPDGLVVGGSLYLEGCTSLTRLPDGLRVGGSLFVTGCKRLRSLPNGLKVERSLFLQGSAVQAIPPDIEVGDNIFGLFR
jgi:hypothetical protein